MEVARGQTDPVGQAPKLTHYSSAQEFLGRSASVGVDPAMIRASSPVRSNAARIASGLGLGFGETNMHSTWHVRLREQP